MFVYCLYSMPMRICSLFFFFKQKTAYELRISDWSSDVCSSDLFALAAASNAHALNYVQRVPASCGTYAVSEQNRDAYLFSNAAPTPDRKSVVSGKSVSVRVDLGGRRFIKKKKARPTAEHNVNSVTRTEQHTKTQEVIEKN